jgi:hypothetical protein
MVISFSVCPRLEPQSFHITAGGSDHKTTVIMLAEGETSVRMVWTRKRRQLISLVSFPLNQTTF